MFCICARARAGRVAGRATRTTCAPMSASSMEAYGVGPMPASTTTLMPVSGPFPLPISVSSPPQAIRSKMAVRPWPPPMHMVSRA